MKFCSQNMSKLIYCALNWNWTPYECVFEWQFHQLPFQTRSLTTPKSLTGTLPKALQAVTHSQSPSDVSLIVTLKQRNWVWTIPTNAVLHSSLINLRNWVPHLHFTICFGVAGWPWYKLHYFLSAAVPSNSPSAAYEWYITTDSCDLGSNAVLRFHTLQLHLLLQLVAPKNIRLQVLTCACQN